MSNRICLGFFLALICLSFLFYILFLSMSFAVAHTPFPSFFIFCCLSFIFLFSPRPIISRPLLRFIDKNVNLMSFHSSISSCLVLHWTWLTPVSDSNRRKISPFLIFNLCICWNCQILCCCLHFKHHIQLHHHHFSIVHFVFSIHIRQCNCRRINLPPIFLNHKFHQMDRHTHTNSVQWILNLVIKTVCVFD